MNGLKTQNEIAAKMKSQNEHALQEINRSVAIRRFIAADLIVKAISQ